MVCKFCLRPGHYAASHNCDEFQKFRLNHGREEAYAELDKRVSAYDKQKQTQYRENKKRRQEEIAAARSMLSNNISSTPADFSNDIEEIKGEFNRVWDRMEQMDKLLNKVLTFLDDYPAPMEPLDEYAFVEISDDDEAGPSTSTVSGLVEQIENMAIEDKKDE